MSLLKTKKIPTRIIAGFLGSGKSTLINQMVESSTDPNDDILLIRCEFGKIVPVENNNLSVFDLSKEAIVNPEHAEREELRELVEDGYWSEIIVEWNGSLSWEDALPIFFDSSKSSVLADLIQIERIAFIGESKMLPALLAAPGSPLPTWLFEADFAILRDSSDKKRQVDVKTRLQAINSDIPVLSSSDDRAILGELYGLRIPGIWKLGLPLFFTFLIYRLSTILNPTLEELLSQIAFRSLALFLQALPYLILGITFSSALQVFLPAGWLQSKFPKKALPGIFFALLAGLFLPVCDCASVPLYRGLRKQGVPLLPALTFLLAAPVMNPVVWLSTLAAFPGRPDFVFWRIGLGALTALLTALSFVLFQPEEQEIALPPPLISGSISSSERPSKLRQFLASVRQDLLKTGSWLLLGILLSALAQSVFKLYGITITEQNAVLSLLLMMGVSFLLSLCSSSDAMVASSWVNILPASAIMGFLVFGPMIDLKNLALLRGSGSSRFTLRLALTCFGISFLLCLGFGFVM